MSIYHVIECPICKVYKTKQQSKFINHLQDVHQITQDNIEQLYVETYYNNAKPSCGCGCGSSLTFYGWNEGYPNKFVRGHNARQFNENNQPEVKEKVILPPVEKKVVEKKVVVQQQRNENYQPKVYKKGSKHKDPIPVGTYVQTDPMIIVNEVFSFIQEECGFEAKINVNDVIPNVKIDILVPSKNLVIQCKNLFLNSDEQLKDKNYHEKELNACINNGYTLFMIYEDEWRDHSKLIKEMIKYRLGMAKVVYDARKLQLRQLTVKERKDFFNMSHLEGDVNATITYGLVTNSDEIVAAFSIRRAFHRRYKEYFEIGRAASKPGSVVRGWIGKLTKVCYKYALEHGRKGLCTYVDSRVGPGKAYIEAGFKLQNDSTGARLWWTDYVNRFNRFQFKADLPNGRNQKQVCLDAGVVAIYGVGNKSLIMNEENT